MTANQLVPAAQYTSVSKGETIFVQLSEGARQELLS
jgi:hypothetical protein